MSEWNIFLIIGELAAFLVVVVPPIVKLNTSIVKLTESINHIEKDYKDAQLKNTESHRRIWDKNEEQDDRLEEHEIRINNLERK